MSSQEKPNMLNLAGQEAALLTLHTKQLETLRSSGLLHQIVSDMTAERDAHYEAMLQHNLRPLAQEVPDPEDPSFKVSVVQQKQDLSGLDVTKTAVRFQKETDLGGGVVHKPVDRVVAETVNGSNFTVGDHTQEQADLVVGLANEVEQARDSGQIPDVKDDLSGIKRPQAYMSIQKPAQ